MNVGEMQRKLSQQAERSPEHQFDDLFNLLYDADWLRLAHDYVAQNAGSVTAGCDGINMKTFDEHLEDNLQTLAKAIKSGSFEPQPVRRVYIPRPDGRKRPLGIHSIRDRIVQEALRMILEPIYEADFSQYSFGFRPNRCTMDAIKCVTWYATNNVGYFWVIEGDISSYFDTIGHRKLMKLLKQRIKDKKVLDLIWKFLRAGVMERRLFHDTNLGVPQGGILSPLLSNIYLHQLDKYMERYSGLSRHEKTRRRKQGLANFAYARYADDWVVLVKGTNRQAEEMKAELGKFLKCHLRLNLCEEKTRISHVNDGFEFLGFKIVRKIGQSGKWAPAALIPQTSLVKFRQKIAMATDPDTTYQSVNSTILALNQIIRGWCCYYRHTAKASSQFNPLRHYVFWRMAHWLGRKHKLKMSEVIRQFCRGSTFANGKYQLLMPTDIKTKLNKGSFKKPNPYTMQVIHLQREELPQETCWTGQEPRPGMADLRPIVLERDGFICQGCGQSVTPQSAQVDHKRPVRRFKRPVEANRLDNLQTLCLKCHKQKHQSDRQWKAG